MTWFRRKWLLIVAVALIAGIAFWRSGNLPPTVTLVRFENDGAGARVAVFQMQNRSRAVYYFAGTRLSSGELRANVDYRFEMPGKGQVRRDYPSRVRYFSPENELQPFETKQFVVPLDFEDGTVITTPFKIGLPFWRRPPELSFQIARWASRWKTVTDRLAPTVGISWSEMVAQ